MNTLNTSLFITKTIIFVNGFIFKHLEYINNHAGMLLY
jgi:hypothetical protein